MNNHDQQYPKEPTYYPPVQNPMMQTSSHGMMSPSSHGDDETAGLLSSPSNPSPAATSSSFLPTWMSPSNSASTSAAAPARIQAYPSLDGVGDAREMTTFSSSGAQGRPNYPVLSTYGMQQQPAPSSGGRPAAIPVTTMPPPAPIVHQPRESTIIQVESTFIEDLIAENSRLTQEVEDLRKIMQMQEQQFQEAMSQLNRAPQQAHYQQAVMPPMGTMNGVALASSAYNPASGVTTLQTSALPQGGTKNVCCGHCRKWLLVPVAANLIFCPNCERVNNCSLAGPAQGQPILR